MNKSSIGVALSILLSGCVISHACAQSDSEAAHEQRFIEFKAFIAKSFGPDAVVSPRPFGQPFPRSATTTISRNAKDENPRAFAANIVPRKDGAALGFVVYGNCDPTPESELPERIIKVDGQKIISYYACKADGKGGDYEGIYVAKSPEGRAFLRARFQKVRYVFVEFEQFTVPFATDGFEKAWADADGVAL
jgi:hypothetical protein